MKATRKPQQKRSLEKQSKILEAAFMLFCEKGFENTNTAEIAKYAGVATGTVYSYFSDKIDIYRTVFDKYLKNEISKMLFILESNIQVQTNIREFVLAWKNSYMTVFGQPNKALNEISTVMSKETNLCTYYSEFEVEYVNNIYYLLKKKYSETVTFEKVWLAFLIVDGLCKEYVSNRHKNINFQQLEEQAIISIETILTN